MKTALVSMMCLASVFCSPCFAQAAETDAVGSLQIHNAFAVSYDDAEQAIATALSQKDITGKLAVTMAGHKNAVLFSYSAPVAVEIKGLTIERISNRWTASLLFVSQGEVVSAIPATGNFNEMVELPVLKRAVRAGDIITEQDLEVRDFSAGHSRTDTITDLSALIGKTPTHHLSPSRPIKTQEVVIPAILKKNAIVEMRYSSPGMEITTYGEAMMEGAMGDVINVKNAASKKIVRAVIADNKTVTVLGNGMETSQLRNDTHAN